MLFLLVVQSRTAFEGNLVDNARHTAAIRIDSASANCRMATLALHG